MSNFKPMLAENVKPEQVIPGSLGSLKLEGVRGVFTPWEGLLSRSLKPVANELIYQRPEVALIEQFCERHSIVLEGEWYVHGWPFSRIDSCLRGNGNIDVNQLEFHVFDCFVEAEPDAPFEKRYGFYQWAVTTLKAEGCGIIEAVEQRPMHDPDAIRNAYCWAIENGYEGFVLKKADGAYKFGRSTVKQGLFTRIKPEDPFDGVVVKIIERQNNLLESEINELGYQYKRQDKDAKQGAGMAQSAIVYTPALGKFHKVSLTRGLTDVDRIRIWEDANYYEGKCLSWVGIPVPGQDIPRSPRFDKWREDLEPQFMQHDPSDSVFASWDPAEIEQNCNNGCDIIPFPLFQGLALDVYK